MIKCEHPIQLKTGLIVPCGKCLLCLSRRRDEWSHRLQLHSYGYDKMPLFVGLTYDNEHLQFANGADGTLNPRDLRLFIKRLKENFNLYNTKFSVFGCGEYGDTYGRPHYHVLFFGFDELSDTFDNDWLGAHELLYSQWQLGNVDIGRAKWSGIHYVTKYVLKYDGENYEDHKPFLVASQGLGLPWLDTPEGLYLKQKLSRLAASSLSLPKLYYDGNFADLASSAADALDVLDSQLPRLVCTTPQGFKVPIPRYIRGKLLGSFEHFLDNPYWLQETCTNIVDSWNHRGDVEYNSQHDESLWQQRIFLLKRKVEQRMYLNSKSFRNETIRIGSRKETCL